jgi:signal recognition particle receptor subunit alpha
MFYLISILLSSLILRALQAVYQSLLHLGWIDKLLDNISALFINIYKDQLRSTRVRVVEYPFDRYFEQQLRALEDNSVPINSERVVTVAERKKDSLVSSEHGGPPPPSVPGLIHGMYFLAVCAREIMLIP